MTWDSDSLINNLVFAHPKSVLLDFQTLKHVNVSDCVDTRFVSPDLKMRYVAAALLTALAGNEITAENIEKILRTGGPKR